MNKLVKLALLLGVSLMLNNPAANAMRPPNEQLNSHNRNFHEFSAPRHERNVNQENDERNERNRLQQRDNMPHYGIVLSF